MQQSSDSGNPYIVPLHTAAFRTVHAPRMQRRMYGNQNPYYNMTNLYGDSRSLIVNDECCEANNRRWNDKTEIFNIPNMHNIFKLDEIYTKYANNLPAAYGRSLDLGITILEDCLKMAHIFDDIKISVGRVDLTHGVELTPHNPILLHSGDVIKFYARPQPGRYPYGNNTRGIDENGRDWGALPFGPLFQIQYVTPTMT
jgi:hypothetical protein